MKKCWIGLTSLLTAALAISLILPRRSEAQYSSPVKVMNSSSAPAINSAIDEPGRTPYQASQQVPIPIASVGFVTVNFSPVPTNHRLVVTRMIGNYRLTAPGITYVLLNAAPEPATRITGLLAPSSPLSDTLFDVPVLAYFDAGQMPQVFAQPYGVINLTSALIGLTGYMIDCSAAPCAPIVTH